MPSNLKLHKLLEFVNLLNELIHISKQYTKYESPWSSDWLDTIALSSLKKRNCNFANENGAIIVSDASGKPVRVYLLVDFNKETDIHFAWQSNSDLSSPLFSLRLSEHILQHNFVWITYNVISAKSSKLKSFYLKLCNLPQGICC